VHPRETFAWVPSRRIAQLHRGFELVTLLRGEGTLQIHRWPFAPEPLAALRWARGGTIMSGEQIRPALDFAHAIGTSFSNIF
jgi:hypothetical protein